jgi:hypothetical protein
MCAGCAITAAAAATGTRSWLQSRGLLSRKHLRRATIALCAVALGVSSVGLGGSSTPQPAAAQPAPAAR